VGAATARALARAGHVVGLLARSQDALEVLADGIRQEGGQATALVADIADAKAVKRAVEELEAAAGPVRVCINNAGMVDPIARVSDLAPADFDRTVAVNLHGAFYAVQAVLPGMIAAGGGCVVQVSSGAAHRHLEGWTSYCVAKAGLWMLTQSLAAELAPEGVSVYGFQPGTVDTEMQARIRQSGINPVSRMARTEHLPARVPAACIAWLVRTQPEDWRGMDVRVDAVQRRMGSNEDG